MTITSRSEQELYRKKLEAIITTPSFDLTGPMALQIISALTTVRSILATEALHNRRQRSLGGSGYQPPDISSRVDELERIVDDVVDMFAQAARPTRSLDD